MKRYFMMIPGQEIKKEFYGDENKQLYSHSKEKVYFAFTNVMKESIKGEEKFEVVAFDSFNNEKSQLNFDLLTNEVNEAFKNQVSIKRIITPLGVNKQEQLATFKTIYTEFKEDDEIYFDITFGMKPVPFTSLVALNYANKFVKGFRLRKITYGYYDFEKRDVEGYIHPIINVTSLYYINDMIDNLSSLNISDPTTILDTLM